MANLCETLKTIKQESSDFHRLVSTVPGINIISPTSVQLRDGHINSHIYIETEVTRNNTRLVVYETFFSDGGYHCGISKRDNCGNIIENEYGPQYDRRDLLPDLIKRRTDLKNVKWFMTPEQYKSFQDHVRKLDCPDTIGDFGAVQVGRFLFRFDLENRRDRELNGYGPENHRIGTLYLAGIPKGNAFCGELDNGVRYTSLTDLVFQNFEEWMRGYYEIGDCPEDISKLTFPVFKDRMEKWVVDNAEVLKTVEGAIAKGEAPADMLTYVEPGWEAWMKSSSAKPTNAETEKDPFVQARAEMEAIFDKAKKDLDEICNRYIEKIKKL